MIYVCDRMMGLGKSTACINYMNAHPEKKFIYITPYTDEDKRIIRACPALMFKEPSDENRATGCSKSGDTIRLLSLGENVASTHQCFKYYTDDVLEYIKKYEYTLMIDENVSVLEEYNGVNDIDLDAMCKLGYLEINNGEYRLTDKKYGGKWGSEFWRLMRSRTLITGGNEHSGSFYYWALPEELLCAFRDVVIMTYLFNGTDMYYYMKIHDIPFEYIGTVHESGTYSFCKSLNEGTSILVHLKDKIHICDNPSRNNVGNDYNALSINWFVKAESKNDVKALQHQLYNWFNNDNRGHKVGKRLWANIGDSWNNNLVYNARATNNYADKTILAYPVNVFVNVDKKNYYARNGFEFDEDQYALSTMIQWIWRSAIRNGKEIWIYIPSRRMRELLQRWLDDLAEEETGATLLTEGGCGAGGEGLQPMLVEREL